MCRPSKALTKDRKDFIAYMDRSCLQNWPTYMRDGWP